MKNKEWTAKLIFMIIIGILVQGLYFFRWIELDGVKYNALLYLFHLIGSGGGKEVLIKDLCSLPLIYEMDWKELQPTALVFIVQLILLVVCQILCLFNTLLVIIKKVSKIQLYILAAFISICAVLLYVQGPIMASDNLITEGYIFIIMLVTGIGIIGEQMIDAWAEAERQLKESKQKDLEEKLEREERLQFEGKYSSLFAQTIWKNFKFHWRTYRIYVFVGTLSISLIFAGFAMWETLKSAHLHENLLTGQGLGVILLGFVEVIAFVAIFLNISVLTFYLKNHVKNYGIFVTLGMRRKTLYSFMALELLSCMLISTVLGFIFGNVLTFLCRVGIGMSNGFPLSLGHITYKTYLLTLACTFLMFLLSVLLTNEVYIDTGASTSGKKAIEREKMPGRMAKYGLIPGIILAIFGIAKYSSITAFEDNRMLIVFFIGLFLIYRNGLVLLLRKRKDNPGKYFAKLLQNNQYYYRYSTTFRYLFFFMVVHVCVLFIFGKGMISSVISTEPEQVFPYDFVCMAVEDDQEIFDRIKEKFHAEIYDFPMVRVSNVDNSEESDNYVAPVFPQGQEIGISESTYQELCKLRGWEVEDAELEADGSDIKVIYQQDQSVKAHLVDYFIGSKKPYIHIGQPIQYYDFIHREEIFPKRVIKKSRTGSLIGSFRQGRHENIVVFSDEYFENVKDNWKKIDFNSGLPIEGETVIDVNIHHWPTRLVLINVADKYQEQAEKELEVFDQNHTFDNKIDSTVLSHYWKKDLVNERKTENFMNTAVNGFIVGIMMIVSLILIYLKTEAELDEKRRQYDFLKCMGMSENGRKKLLRKERDLFLWVPLFIGIVLSILLTLIIWDLRQYSVSDCINYTKVWFFVLLVHLIIQIAGTRIFETLTWEKIEE